MNAGGDSTDNGDEGGDPACWLGRVCPECGRFADEPPPTTCVRCGTELPSVEPEGEAGPS